jgi:hypothetical protein
VKKYLNTYVTFNKLNAFLGVVEDGSLKLINHDIEDTDYQQIMIQNIIESFVNNDAIHFFDEIALSTTTDLKPEEKIDLENDSIFITGKLLSIPDFANYSYNQLRLIRNEFKELFNLLYLEINRWIKQMYAVEFDLNEENRKDYTVFEKLNEFDKLLSDAEDQNIYFQSIKQSDPDNQFRDLYYGITSIKSAINLYRKTSVINKNEEAYIVDKIAKFRNINSHCFFLFHKISKKEKPEPEEVISQE